MPPLPPAPGVIKLEFLYQDTLGEAREFANILHIGYQGAAPSDAQLAILGGDLVTLWHTTVMNQMSSDIVLSELKLTDLTSDTSAATSVSASLAGGTGSAYNSAASAAVISWTISRRYRGGHPRTYLVGVPVGDIINGYQLAALYVTDLGLNAVAWLDGVLAEVLVPVGPFRAVNVSYVHGGVRRVAPVVDDILGAQVHPRLDTQRRRLGKEST